jgi:peptide/nickel transport system permease protein
MLKLILKRVPGILALLLTVTLSSFILIRLAPGDFLSEMSVNPQISRETVESFRKTYGLDQPWHIQFRAWVKQILRGDLGYSFIYNRPVTDLIEERVFNTVALALTALVLSLSIAIPCGVIAGSGRFRLLNHILSLISTVSISLPSLLLALLAILFAAKSGSFPLGGVSSLESENLNLIGRIGDFLHHLALPAAVLALRQLPGYFLQLRTSMREILSQEFILTARAKGISEQRVLFKHGFRNAVNPLITMFGNSLGSLLSGAFIVEAVMSWPGIGSLAINSLLSRDLYVLMGCLIYTAVLLAAGNLLADLLLAASDPRIRH